MAINLKICHAFQALSAKNQKFVLEYLKDFNATQAAIRAGYSKKTADVQGSRLLSNANVEKAIEEVKSQLHNKDIADVEEVAQFLTSVMRGNIADIATWDETGLSFLVKNPSNDEAAGSAGLDRSKTRLIKKIKVTEKTSQKGDWTECKTEVELHDPVHAAELLGRYNGMFKDKLELSGKVAFEDISERFEAARKRSLEAMSARRGKG